MDTDERQSMLFLQLIALFQSTALQQMGKLKNPMTDKIERELEQAKISIDMIEMLHAKTKGNLREEEERMMSAVLRDLRLNYVDEVNKPAPPSSPSSPAQEGAKP
jgi:hypothetical protein